jgi:hypothetical protein
VTREGTRLFAAILAAAIVMVLLAACGSSDSDSSSSTAVTTAGGATTDTAQGGGGARGDSQDQGNGKSQGGSPDDQSQSPQGDSDGTGAAKNAVTPLQVSGGGSEQFRTKGGDNSVQEYGEEGDESELREVAEIVHSFYVARAEEKWEQACSYLAKSNVEQLEELASQSPQFKGKGCAPILAAFTRPLPAAIQREITTVDAGSFRHDDEQGFLIYYGPDRETVYSMPMRNEGGAWRVSALAGSAIG